MRRIRFYYHLGVFQVFGVFFLRSRFTEIYYFNISKFATLFLFIFGLNKTVRLYDFILSEIRDERGESYFQKIFSEHPIHLCHEIRDNILKNNSFLCSFGALFNQDRILTCMTKCVYEEIRDLVIFCNVIHWHASKLEKQQLPDITFMIPSSPYAATIKGFALREFSIRIIPHISFQLIQKRVSSTIKNIGKLFLCFFEPFTFKNIISFLCQSKVSSINTPKVGISYSGFGITFNKTERCEFPWLFESQIPHEQICLYFRRSDIPIPKNSLRLLSEQSIYYTSFSYDNRLSQYVGAYSPTFHVSKLLFRFSLKTFYLLVRECVLFRWSSVWYLDKMIAFIVQYSRAHDFYLINNIRVSIDYNVFGLISIAEQQALADLGGVSVSFQLSNHPDPNILFATCADIRFIFGPHYYRILQQSETHNSHFICYGYFSDYAFVAAKEQSIKLRRRLQDNGVQFIISYFDENSSNDRMSGVPNATSTFIYKKLFDWVINDETLGLICSPKAPTTLFKRISEIHDLAEKAKETGRCVFMESAYLTVSYPTESAQASDIAIAHLAGGTVAMESYLSGVRTVYLDLDGLYSFPEYQLGKGKIVFDDLDMLIHAINAGRKDKEVLNILGNKNMVPYLEQKDPFQDGKAALRMGQYIYWLLEKMNTGVLRDDVIAYANEQYGKSWGRENILSSLL